MGIADRVWNAVRHDLRTGQNVELYVLVAVAATLIVLTTFGFASPASVAAATLAVLALLGVSLLRLRHQIEDLTKSASASSAREGISSLFFRREDSIDEIRESIRSARSVWLWGATLSQHLPILSPVIADCMRRNALDVRILLIEDAGASIEMAAFRAGGGTTSARLSEDLRTNIDRLKRDTIDCTTGRVEIRVVNYLAPCVIYAYDPLLGDGTANPQGRLELRITSFRGNQDRRPTFTLTGERDPEWYMHFCSDFQNVWDVAHPV